MSKILEGRFNDSQAGQGLIKDLIDNKNVSSVLAIVKFKDGSMDVFGDMNITDMCYGVKIIDSEFIHNTIQGDAGTAD